MMQATDAPRREEAILVTGANGGIGSAMVKYLISRGFHNIAGQYRSSSDQLTALLEGSGLDPSRHAFRAELTDEAQVEELRDAVEREFGSIPILINVAGGSTNGMAWKLSIDDFSGIVDTNLTSTFLCCRAFIPQMRDAGFGRVINVSSVVSAIGSVGASHYAASKSAVNGFTKSLALEVANKGITVNAIALGYFDSGIIHSVPPAHQERIRAAIPMGRFGDSAREVGPLVEYLIGPGASYLTGQVLHLSGGLY